MEPITRLGERLPPLKQRKNPSLAAIIGFLFGGIGLAIYFRSFVDLLIPLAIAFLLTYAVGTYGYIAGAIIAGIWGLVRAIISNEKLEAAPTEKPPSP